MGAQFTWYKQIDTCLFREYSYGFRKAGRRNDRSEKTFTLFFSYEREQWSYFVN